MHPLDHPLRLPCGVEIKNRFAKSAMSEILGTRDHAPSIGLSTLYTTWARGGTGLLITGNVMIDRNALGEPKNVVLEEERHITAFRSWAQSATHHGAQIWMQLNHPGKQSPTFLSRQPVAPSAIPLSGPLGKFFSPPRALEASEILQLVERFACAAEIAKKAGFTGVQIHGAHGYLVSQFLSPLHNQRQDQWGGSLENRMRFVSAVYQRMREKVGKHFPIGIKINSSDFRKQGFSQEEAYQVIRHLCELGIDLVEISGGSYENPVMMGGKEPEKKYEAYFWDFAQTCKQSLSVPLMLTGGFRKAETMVAAIETQVCDMIGLARPLTVEPDFPQKIFTNPSYQSSIQRLTTGFKTIDSLSMLNITWYEQQIALLSQGKPPAPHLNPWVSLFKTFSSMGWNAFKKRRT